MSRFPSCSLVISTYNWPEALEVCLLSILHQTVLPQEVVIADDGSREDTFKLIESYKSKFPVPIHHVWHPDNGFQVGKARNRAFAKSKYDYIVQIDGDVILHPKFIYDHLNFAASGYFLSGSRMLMTPELSKKILKEKRTLISLFEKGVNNKLNGIRFPIMSHILSPLYRVGEKKYYVKGCNMSFWRQDLIDVNGYDENFIGWGREDSDLAIRLMNNGKTKRFLKQRAVMCHIWHKVASRDYEKINITRMNEAIQNKLIWVDNGMDKYLNELELHKI
ncbi:glycosyltransferase family 2 protein [Cytophagaceae bacterium YF14B1]|uniref:Glycosyltransferase family 2 protein n=1 Tax=Xanthocytophaga flava TaxID=3048013 RepID=A0AAE3QW50_9BACT|nr:glycosyltransferase family 2 protein [Xanthocytophaga flavus]MDJ1484565.1 glycosyltransferase family 2 protein [Xanthocytophaga flavus]